MERGQHFSCWRDPLRVSPRPTHPLALTHAHLRAEPGRVCRRAGQGVGHPPRPSSCKTSARVVGSRVPRDRMIPRQRARGTRAPTTRAEVLQLAQESAVNTGTAHERRGTDPNAANIWRIVAKIMRTWHFVPDYSEQATRTSLPPLPAAQSEKRRPRRLYPKRSGANAPRPLFFTQISP